MSLNPIENPIILDRIITSVFFYDAVGASFLRHSIAYRISEDIVSPYHFTSLIFFGAPCVGGALQGVGAV